MTQQQKLDIIYRLQQKYPGSHIGGSFGIFLHGYDLDRELSDIDMCVPEKIEVLENQGNDNDFSSSVGDFDYVFSKDGITYNIKVDPEQKYVIKTYNGLEFRVTNIKTIMEYKQKYSEHSEKHKSDVSKLINQFILKIDTLI